MNPDFVDIWTMYMKAIWAGRLSAEEFVELNTPDVKECLYSLLDCCGYDDEDDSMYSYEEFQRKERILDFKCAVERLC